MLASLLKSHLEAKFHVFPVLSDGQSAVESAFLHRPEIVVWNMALPLLNGVSATRQIKEALPETQIVVIGFDVPPARVAQAFRAGASAFVTNSDDVAVLLKAIETVRAHKRFLTPQFRMSINDLLLKYQEQENDSVLSTLEYQIVELLSEGKSLKETAAALSISIRAVTYHKYRVMAQHGLRTNSDVYRFSIEQGIFTDLCHPNCASCGRQIGFPNASSAVARRSEAFTWIPTFISG